MSGNIWFAIKYKGQSARWYYFAIFEKMNVKMGPQKDGHQLKTNSSSKKNIIKLSKRKDADKTSEVITKLRSLKSVWMDINSHIFINDSLCGFYRKLKAKYIFLWILVDEQIHLRFLDIIWVSKNQGA